MIKLPFRAVGVGLKVVGGVVDAVRGGGDDQRDAERERATTDVPSPAKARPATTAAKPAKSVAEPLPKDLAKEGKGRQPAPFGNDE